MTNKKNLLGIEDCFKAQTLRDRGLSVLEVCANMGLSDPTVRSLLAVAAAPPEIQELVKAEKVAIDLVRQRLYEYGPAAFERLLMDIDRAHRLGRKKATRSVMDSARLSKVQSEKFRRCFSGSQVDAKTNTITITPKQMKEFQLLMKQLL